MFFQHVVKGKLARDLNLLSKNVKSPWFITSYCMSIHEYIWMNKPIKIVGALAGLLSG